MKATNRPKKLRQWNEDSMRRAYEAVTTQKMGVNRVALEFHVSRSYHTEGPSIVEGDSWLQYGPEAIPYTRRRKRIGGFLVELR